jgi:hypothetical protein
MIFQGAMILPHIVVYHNKSKALVPWKVKQKQANKPKKKGLTKMIDVYKHALIGGKWCTSFWVKSLIQWKKINIWMDYYLASTHSLKLQYLWKYIILISNPINQGIISRTHNYLFAFTNHGAICGKHMNKYTLSRLKWHCNFTSISFHIEWYKWKFNYQIVFIIRTI